MKVDAVAFSFAGDKYLGRPYSEMDCQTFVEKCMSDCGLHKDLAGSNTWYREVMNHGWVGSPEDCMREFGVIPKGALLFILEHDGGEPDKYKKDGIGNAKHIGFKTGRNDGAIHSSQSRGCVATSNFKDKTIPNGGWNRVGLYNQFTYGKSVDWILEHGADNHDHGGDDVHMKAIVVADSGSTVKLRQKPSTSCNMYWDISVGTEVEVVDKQDDWCKVITSGLTGWMMTQFLQFETPDVPDPDEDPDDPDVDPGETLTITLSYTDCANAYPLLRALCDQIEKEIGRG